ncbi:MAG: FGGY-family carbohydrate kinase [Thermomicrobiales bacterium]
MPAGTAIGVVGKDGASATGLREGTVIGLGGHDHVCGAFAAGVTQHGAVLDSMGTAEALFVALDAPIWDQDFGRAGYTQGAHVVAGKYYGFGGLYTSGAAIDWIRSITGREDRMALSGEAGSVPPGSNGVTFLPHLRLGGPPNIDGRSRGAFLGLTTDIDQGALVRAVYEGLAYVAILGRTTGCLCRFQSAPRLHGDRRQRRATTCSCGDQGFGDQSTASCGWPSMKPPRWGSALLGGLAAGTYSP